MSNVHILTGYSCNGKTSLLPALKWNLELKYPNKKVIIVNESVTFGFNAVNLANIEKQFKQLFDFRQYLFLSSALAQLDLIMQFYNNPDYIVLCDRNIVDVFVFTFMDVYDKDVFKNEFKAIEEELMSKYKDFCFGLSTDFKYFYFLPPKNPEVLNRCFDRKERKETISLTEFHDKERKFRYYYKYVISEYSFKMFNHPSDNTYVLYQVLQEIVDIIDNED